MKYVPEHPTRRVGGVVPLTALLLIPLTGMLAFSIDIGYIVVVQTELQDAADAAALAGVQKLQNLYVQYNIPTMTNSQKNGIKTTAITNTGTSASPIYTAEQFAKYNKAGGVYINVPDSDVDIGFMDSSGNYTHSYGTNFPNTVRVTTRRQGALGGTTNGSLPLFFARIFGMNTKDLQATAQATIYAGDVTSYQPISGFDSHVLPVALDKNTWTHFFSTGQSPDGTTHYAPNGYPELQVYPDPGNAPGQFGLLDVGAPANDVPTFRNWIADGETPNDIQYMLDHNLLPVSPTNPEPWKGGPGLKSTLQASFQQVIGDPNVIPIFQPAQGTPFDTSTTYIPTYDSSGNPGGNGSSTYYHVIGFVGVTVTRADGNGNNMNISVQPMAVIDATSVISTPQPAGTQSSSFGTTATTFISAKLTQ
ncbi:MAG: hypothetical protein JO112_08860 [Planctomycetes bacterium]|nr:hypothetical protein [Planctomycetota bacterium]